MPLSHALPDTSPRCPPDVCVAAVLGDALHRVSVLGGREGLPRSLGSVYSGCVALFLGGSLRSVGSRVINTPRVKSWCNGVAVSRDGTTLLVSDFDGGSDAIHEYSVADGSRRRVVGRKGRGPLQFNSPCQVWIAPDDFVFVADLHNSRVQVLTPSLDFHGFVGVGQARHPTGVCANADVVVVSESLTIHRISVFRRDDGALLRRFGSSGSGDGGLKYPMGLCFMSRDRHVAVADLGNNRVSVFSVVDGEFVRHVGVGTLKSPTGVACSGFDELVVAGVSLRGGCRLVLFGDTGDMHEQVAWGDFVSVSIHGSTVVAHGRVSHQCVVI